MRNVSIKPSTANSLFGTNQSAEQPAISLVVLFIITLFIELIFVSCGDNPNKTMKGPDARIEMTEKAKGLYVNSENRFIQFIDANQLRMGALAMGEITLIPSFKLNKPKESFTDSLDGAWKSSYPLDKVHLRAVLNYSGANYELEVDPSNEHWTLPQIMSGSQSSSSRNLNKIQFTCSLYKDYPIVRLTKPPTKRHKKGLDKIDSKYSNFGPDLKYLLEIDINNNDPSTSITLDVIYGPLFEALESTQSAARTDSIKKVATEACREHARYISSLPSYTQSFGFPILTSGYLQMISDQYYYGDDTERLQVNATNLFVNQSIDHPIDLAQVLKSVLSGGYEVDIAYEARAGRNQAKQVQVALDLEQRRFIFNHREVEQDSKQTNSEPCIYSLAADITSVETPPLRERSSSSGTVDWTFQLDHPTLNFDSDRKACSKIALDLDRAIQQKTPITMKLSPLRIDENKISSNIELSWRSQGSGTNNASNDTNATAIISEKITRKVEAL